MRLKPTSFAATASVERIPLAVAPVIRGVFAAASRIAAVTATAVAIADATAAVAAAKH